MVTSRRWFQSGILKKNIVEKVTPCLDCSSEISRNTLTQCSQLLGKLIAQGFKLAALLI